MWFARRAGSNPVLAYPGFGFRQVRKLFVCAAVEVQHLSFAVVPWADDERLRVGSWGTEIKGDSPICVNTSLSSHRYGIVDSVCHIDFRGVDYDIALM